MNAPFALRRFGTIEAKQKGLVLHGGHPALRQRRTIFTSRVAHASTLDRLLISGHNNRKIGKTVTKGAWAGFPIYTLTLEERATCPASCRQWSSCYGNNMNWSIRIIADEAFEARLRKELETLNAKHPGGFAVRLHVLGDFYDEIYVDLWRHALADLPALHVWGYSAWAPSTDVGRALVGVIRQFPVRFALRFSGRENEDFSTAVIPTEADAPAGFVVCPAQTGKTDCCATCALCWQSRVSIAFLEH